MYKDDKAYLFDLISGGESQTLDFKYQISDSEKIAKTLVAFANTEGGRLLIGVKDNGKIKGVASDEEIYMIDTAAIMFCKPEVKLEKTEREVDGKVVLEIYVPPSSDKPHYVRDRDNKWWVYVRVNDENLMANSVLIEVLKRKQKNSSTFIKYKEHEKLLLDYLKENSEISMSHFLKIAKIPAYLAKKILVNLVSVGVLKLHITRQRSFYTLPDADKSIVNVKF